MQRAGGGEEERERELEASFDAELDEADADRGGKKEGMLGIDEMAPDDSLAQSRML